VVVVLVAVVLAGTAGVLPSAVTGVVPGPAVVSVGSVVAVGPGAGVAGAATATDGRSAGVAVVGAVA
jgi:hypothetical protein